MVKMVDVAVSRLSRGWGEKVADETSHTSVPNLPVWLSEVWLMEVRV